MPRETAANAQTRIIERDLTALSNRFDRHLEIYAQNGKELAGVKVAVDNLRTTIEQRHVQYENNQQANKVETREYTDKMNALEIDLSKLGTKVAMFATFGSAVASTVTSALMQFFL